MYFSFFFFYFSLARSLSVSSPRAIIAIHESKGGKKGRREEEEDVTITEACRVSFPAVSRSFFFFFYDSLENTALLEIIDLAFCRVTRLIARRVVKEKNLLRVSLLRSSLVKRITHSFCHFVPHIYDLRSLK